MSKQALLSSFRKLVQLKPGQEARMLDFFEEASYSKKAYVLQKGEVNRYEYFVVKGCLRTFVLDQNGAEHTWALHLENWWTGDLQSFINRAPAEYNIQALEEVELLGISRENWDKVLTEIPELERGFRVMFQNALIAQQKRIIQNLSLSAEERYRQYFAQYPQIFQRVPLKYIASYLGITPEFLSMLRSRLAKAEILN